MRAPNPGHMPNRTRSPRQPLPTKHCATCGRRFAWRSKWSDSWDEVRYCSTACRSRRPGPLDRDLEAAIIELTRRRGSSASICPSDAARSVDPDRWRSLMERTRRAGRRLAMRGEIVVLQGGRPVDATDAKGAIRYRITERSA